MIISFLLLAGATLLSSNTFLLAGGSDSGVHIISSSMGLKIISVLLAAGLLGVSIWLKSKYPSAMLACLLLMATILSLASHSVVLNHRHGTLEERWLLMKFIRADYDIAEGIGYDWVAEPGLLGVQFTAKKADKSFFVFTGPAPWLTPFKQFLKELTQPPESPESQTDPENSLPTL